VVFVTVRASGGRGNTAGENWPRNAFLRAGRVRTPVFRLGVVASAEWADHRVLTPGFNMATLPAVAALGRGGGRVGSFNHKVAAI